MANPSFAADLRQPGDSLPPADVLLHEIDLAGGDVDVRAAIEFHVEMLFGTGLLLQQLQPSIAADSVRHVHHQVALAEL